MPHTCAHTQTDTHTHTDTSTLGYYMAIKKGEILSSVTTWRHLDDIILSEVSQTIYVFL